MSPGAEKFSGSVPLSEKRAILESIYASAYDRNPSKLAWWDLGEWSLIGTEGCLETGSLHAPMSPDGFKGVRVKAESILHQKENGWSFKGAFGYSIGVTDTLRSNLSFVRKPYGSPSFYYCKAPARTWEAQRYVLSATATKNFNGKWALGAQIDYTGDKQFRKSDVRNNQSALEMAIEVGGSVLLGMNILSAGLSYERNKEQPDFSRLYNTGLDYTIYLMNGLGTQVMNQYSNMVWTQNVPGAYIDWELRGKKNRLSIGYSFKSGADGWKNKSTQTTSRQEKWSEYSFMSHRLNVTDILRLSEGNTLIFNYKIRFTSGQSSNWSQSAGRFISDYNADQYESGVKVEYVSQGWFRKAGLDAGLNGESLLDKNYNARLDYQTLTGIIFTGFGVHLGKTDLCLDLTGGYVKSPMVDYAPNAAKDGSNIYTTNIGRYEEAWLKTGRWNAGATLQAEIPARKTLVNIGTSYNYTWAGASDTYKNLNLQECRIFLNICF